MGYRAFTAEEIERGLLAVVQCAGTFTMASRMLADDDPPLEIAAGTLTRWCTHQYAGRYGELRDKYSAELEERLVHNLRERAVRAGEVSDLAVEAAYDRLIAGQDDDPAKTAANLSRVTQISADKMLAVSGRPTSIREDRRNPEEILRSLIAKYPQMISLPDEAVTELDEPAQLEAGEADAA